ncbi:MAG: hypothetical protein Q9178_007122 [Gyalolechia marmorata]
MTPATTKSASSIGDNIPVFVGTQRHRRYVIRGAIGRNALTEPDGRLLEDTEELLQLWQAPGPRSRDLSSRKATGPPDLTKRVDEWTLTPPPSACKVSQLADNAVTNRTSLPYATSHGSAASSLGSQGPNGPLRIDSWPATNSKSYDMSAKHLVRSPATITARSLHTSTVCIETPNCVHRLIKAKVTRQQVESQPTSPAEGDIAPLLPEIREVGIRKHLKLWQELQNKDQMNVLQSTGSTVARPVEDDTDRILETNDNALRDLEPVNATGVDQEGDTDDQPFLQSGDVVDISTKYDSILAIFTRRVGNQAQYYSVQGKWFHRPIRRVFHTIPQMFSLEELEPILPYLPTEEIDNDALDKLHALDASIPRSIGATLLQRLQAFHRASAEVYREHLERIDRVHSLVAHEWKRRAISLHEIASIVLQKPDVKDLTEVELYTIHKVLIKDSKFRPQLLAKHRLYPVWKVNPFTQIREYEKVKQWLREHLEVVITQATSTEDMSNPRQRDKDVARLNPISRFVKKARSLIQASRVHRNVTTYSSIGPSNRQVEPGPSNSDAVISISTMTVFDPEERIIIEYLKDWVLSNHMPNIENTWSLSPMLLRAIGMYEGYDLAEATGSLLLRELGVIAPWENEVLYSPNLRLPHKYDPQTMQQWKNASDSVEAIVQSREHLEDSLESFRKDWGSTNVYCIDQAGARDIDDGVSVERIDGHDSVFWVHIHVASPAAFIKPGSAIAKYAATLQETYYLPEMVYPMLKSDLTQRHFSLANDRPVVTFSAKITTDGEILATEVTPGWVRKIKQITPDRVHRELGFGTGAPSSVSQTITVGQHVAREEVSEAPENTPLSTSETLELRLLHKLGSARRIKRSAMSVTELAFTEVSRPRVYTQRNGMDLTYSPKLARQFIGDPTISWEVREISFTSETRQNAVDLFVKEMMIMAGEIAARWCGERNIPIPYRGTIRNPSLITTPEAYKARVLDPVMAEMGYVPNAYRRSHSLLVGTTSLQSSPIRHALLNTQAYTKATSPLRRYPDMVTHWQMQAALRHEAQHGQGSLIGNVDDSYLPFSRADMDAMLPTIAMREHIYKGVQKWSMAHWTTQLLHRAFEYKQAPLPSIFDILVHTEKDMLHQGRGENMGSIKQLSGIDADIVENDVSDRQGGFKLGDWWQARIERVETFKGRIRMLPIRLIQRASEDIQTRYKTSTAYGLYQSPSKI